MTCSATHICFQHLIPVPRVGLDDPCRSLTIWDILWLFKKISMNYGFLFTVCLRSHISKGSKRLVLLTGKKSLNLTFFFLNLPPLTTITDSRMNPLWLLTILSQKHCQWISMCPNIWASYKYQKIYVFLNLTSWKFMRCHCTALTLNLTFSGILSCRYMDNCLYHVR